MPHTNGKPRVGRAGNSENFCLESTKSSESTQARTEAQAPVIDEDASASSFDDLLAELGRLSPAEYGAQRANFADRLGIPLSFLDKEYDERHKQFKKEREPECSSAPAADEPWPEPVNGDALLHAIVKRLKSHVVFSDNQATAVALWIFFAWTHGAFVHSPALLATSPEANSGKSTLLGIVCRLVPKGLLLINPSSSVLYRMIERWRPTLIADEADTQFKDCEDLRAVFNSGWTRGSGVPRCNPDTNEPEIFDTFAPKAIGMKGRWLPDTTLSRCIVIEMKRKKPGVKAAEFEHIDDDQLANFRRLLARWAADNVESLKSAQPAMPDGFENRLRANWRPLLAIADAVGGEWPELARVAAEDIGRRETEHSIGVTALIDIKAAFEAKRADRIASSDLVDALVAMEGRSWAEFGKGQRPISQHKLSGILKEFGVYPEKIRFGTRTAGGYYLDRFQEAFDTYLPQAPLFNSEHRNTPSAAGTSGVFNSEHGKPDVPTWNGKKPANDGHCSDVPTWEGVSPEDGACPPLICAHCGKSAEDGNPVHECAIGGETVFLHRRCQAAYVDDFPELPDFLDRRQRGAA